MSPLSLSTRRDGGRAIVALAGELDIESVDELRTRALAELDAEGCTGLVLDVDGLEFLDSTGIGCWIDLRNHAEEAGKTFELTGASAAVRRTVTIAGLAPLFGVEPAQL